MKITEIKAYPVWVGIRNQLIVKVETDEGIYRLGRERASRAASWRWWAPSSTTASSSSAGPDQDRRAVAGDVPQPVFRGRARAARRPSRPSTSRCTTSRARRWACRSTSCSAASSATSSPASPRPRRRRGREMIEQAQDAGRAAAGTSIRGCHAHRPSRRADALRAARVDRPRPPSGCTKVREALGAGRRCWGSTTTTA